MSFRRMILACVLTLAITAGSVTVDTRTEAHAFPAVPTQDENGQGLMALGALGLLGAFFVAMASLLGLDGGLNPVAAEEDASQPSPGPQEPQAPSTTAKDAAADSAPRPAAQLREAAQQAGVGSVFDMSANPQLEPALASDSHWLEAARTRVAEDVMAYRTSMSPAKEAIWDEGLDKSAQHWADHLASVNGFFHSDAGAEEAITGVRRNSENLAAGSSPEEVVNMWHTSKGHCVNLQDTHGYGDFPYFGVGVAHHPHWGAVYVLQFAKEPQGAAHSETTAVVPVRDYLMSGSCS